MLDFKLPFDVIFHMLIKGALSGLRQFLATESPLKMMKKRYNPGLLFQIQLKFYTCKRVHQVKQS